MSDIAWYVDRIDVSYWFVDLREPPSHPAYAALFIGFFVILVLSIHVYRAAPDWLLPGPQVRHIRRLVAGLAALALVGDTLILAELMLVPFASKRIWLWLSIALLLAQLSYIARRISHQHRPSSEPSRREETE